MPNNKPQPSFLDAVERRLLRDCLLQECKENEEILQHVCEMVTYNCSREFFREMVGINEPSYPIEKRNK